MFQPEEEAITSLSVEEWKEGENQYLYLVSVLIYKPSHLTSIEQIVYSSII